jgi:hypothetical protein
MSLSIHAWGVGLSLSRGATVIGGIGLTEAAHEVVPIRSAPASAIGLHGIANLPFEVERCPRIIPLLRGAPVQVRLPRGQDRLHDALHKCG